MLKLTGGLLLIVSAVVAQERRPAELINGGRPMVDAHNCYPYEGRWADRIDRALAATPPVSIEQDLAWYADPATGAGRAVISHTTKTTGSEPTLREHFFERVRPIVEKALAENDQAHWPVLILHFDFKSNEASLLHAVWNLLGEYEGWLTTAVKTTDPSKLMPFQRKPLLVLTEDSDAQEQVFFSEVPAGAKLRLFGSAHSTKIPDGTPQEKMHIAATLAPEKLLTERPTNYRRWWNNSWYEVEEGGQNHAGKWTPDDEQRLKSLVDHAHRLGFWIRFYTLDGFTAEENKGWDQNYNFGSRSSVELRWKAAAAAGVDMIATDQYEDLSAFLTHR